MIQPLKTVQEHDEFTQQEGVRVVHYGFQWNSFDRMMQRNLVELVPEFGERAAFGYVDVDQNATVELIQRINLVNVPTLVYFKNGEQQLIQVGMRTMDDIRSAINDLLNSEQ